MMLYFFAIIISSLLSIDFSIDFLCSRFCESSNICDGDIPPVLFEKTCSLNCASLRDFVSCICNFCANITRSSLDRLFKSFFLDSGGFAFIYAFMSFRSFSEE